MSVKLKRFGSDYGGYWIPDPRYVDWTYTTVYDCGVGEDASFCEELYKYEEEILDYHLFDPTPRARKYWNDTQLNKWAIWYIKPQFHYIGVAGINGDYKFYPPANPAHVSHSILNLQNTENPIIVRCYNLRTIMDILGHRELDLLKLDIEGAENGVLFHMKTEQIYPKVMAIDSHGAPGESIDISFHPFLTEHYDLICKEGDNYSFLRKKI